MLYSCLTPMVSSNIEKWLAQAKAQYRRLNLREAYRHFRRCFDTLPVACGPQHMENIGMFVRTLCELGKEEELEFYIRALEKWHWQIPSPELAYALAVAYRGSLRPRAQQSRELLEKIIRHQPASLLRARAKMLLANHLSRENLEPGTLRTLVHSLFDEPLDEELEILAEVWSTWTSYTSGQPQQALIRVQNLVAAVLVQDHWFAAFSCRYLAADLLQMENLHDEANHLIMDLRALYQCKPVASLHRKIAVLEHRIAKFSPEHRLTVFESESWTLSYRNRTLEMNRASTLGKLLQGFIDSTSLDKQDIIRHIDGRDYAGKKDDERIYSSIHRLRRKLMELGLPNEVIEGDRKQGYRLQLTIERQICQQSA